MVQTFEVGDRVTATYSGQTYTGTVRRVTNEIIVQFDADSVPNWAYTNNGPNGERWDGSYGVYPGGAIELAKVENVAFNGDHADTLRSQNEALRAELADARRTHRNDISYMADALKTAAEENELCEVFERQVQNIGSGLSSLVSESFIEEASRNQEHTYRISIAYTDVVLVTAHNDEEAQEMVESDPGAYFDRHSASFSVDEVEEDD